MKSQFWSKQFEAKAKNPVTWALLARRLKHAADLVFTAYVSDLNELGGGCSPLGLSNLEIVGPATLLYGLAFENILKALIIRKEGIVINQGKFDKWPGSGHGLIDLANRAGVKLTKVQRDLLSRLTAYVEWSGRYPIPMAEDRMLLKQVAISTKWFPLPVQPGERAAVDGFYQKLDAQVLA
jgi:hypothetical protein